MTIPELKHLESLTDFAFFGDLMGYTEVMLMGEAEFIHMMTDNDCVWGGKDSFDNENPQKYDNCPVISAKRTVGAVIADKTYYNYEVILDINYYGGNSRLSRYNFPSSLKYLILPHFSSNLSGLPRYLYQNHFADMKYIDGLDADLYLENGMFIRERDDELELIFYISEEDVIKIDSDVYTINIGFDTSPNIKEVKVTGNGDYYSVDGIIYKNDSSTNDMTTLIYIPRSYDKNTFTMPDDLLNIYSFYNDNIEVIEVNDDFRYIETLSSMFVKLKSITNFENNPNVYYEDGVFYEDDTKEVIVFVDASVKTLVLNDSVKSVYNYAIKSVEELQLNDSINHLIYQALLNVSNLNKLVVPKTNPYLIYEDNVLYRTSDNSVIYNKELADEYYLLAILNPDYNEEYNIVTTLNNEITKGKIRFILGDPLVFSVPVFINGLEASSFAYTKKLESITLNEYIEVLPRELFSLENLKSITLESSNLVRVESDYDFVENPDFQESMFYILNRGSIEHIYVPRDLLEEYKTDVFWGQFSDIIEPI
ncbi:MAG: leucine-rich repeat protein [Candidatus Izemoplasmatales bacterium]